MDKQMRKWGFVSLLNTASLCIVVIVLVGLFAGWPIYRCGPWLFTSLSVSSPLTGVDVQVRHRWLVGLIRHKHHHQLVWPGAVDPGSAEPRRRVHAHVGLHAPGL